MALISITAGQVLLLRWVAQCSINVDTIGGKRIPLQSRTAFNFYILTNSSKLASLGDLSFRASFGSIFKKTEIVKVIESLTTKAFLMRVNLAESDLKWNFSLEIEVTFPFRLHPALTSWTRVSKVLTSTLQRDGKLPIDLKFIICTRMSPRGHIGYPKAIFASSALLKGYTPFVDKYIVSTGVKAVNLDLDDCESAMWGAYDYDADSDFDEDDGDKDTMDIDAALVPHTTEFNYPNRQLAYDERISSVHPSQGPSSYPPESPPRTVSPSLSMVDTLDPPPEEDIAEPLDRPLSSVLTDYGDQNHEAEVQGVERFGSVWHVNDAAYRTWKTLLAYLYTREISFASLKSNETPRIVTTDACSPKSMYRLAVKANLDGLQELAFENLRSQLTPSNIIAEVFSKFSGQHTKILDMEVKYLVDNFADPLVYPQWQKKMAEVGRGECPHGTEVMNRVILLTLLKGQSTTDVNTKYYLVPNAHGETPGTNHGENSRYKQPIDVSSDTFRSGHYKYLQVFQLYKLPIVFVDLRLRFNLWRTVDNQYATITFVPFQLSSLVQNTPPTFPLMSTTHLTAYNDVLNGELRPANPELIISSESSLWRRFKRGELFEFDCSQRHVKLEGIEFSDVDQMVHLLFCLKSFKRLSITRVKFSTNPDSNSVRYHRGGIEHLCVDSRDCDIARPSLIRILQCLPSLTSLEFFNVVFPPVYTVSYSSDWDTLPLSHRAKPKTLTISTVEPINFRATLTCIHDTLNLQDLRVLQLKVNSSASRDDYNSCRQLFELSELLEGSENLRSLDIRFQLERIRLSLQHPSLFLYPQDCSLVQPTSVCAAFLSHILHIPGGTSSLFPQNPRMRRSLSLFRIRATSTHPDCAPAPTTIDPASFKTLATARRPKPILDLIRHPSRHGQLRKALTPIVAPGRILDAQGEQMGLDYAGVPGNPNRG
ncbi:uncharacterized protein ARMOST_18089 [Armillaria ostoyae]|uniref:Uncharacterized protein n=1 Tax=Armillaria ostoyae TaxID=47428 RepID=A0A284S109_ARMOS|nr:uncharacterized protein ARMOST_18089 [Armillaria ostoyae]